jgi:hypothetical protein
VPQQLCVPVMKNQRKPPTAILPYVQYADVLCYGATGAPLGQNLTRKQGDHAMRADGPPGHRRR